jgi:hypothetical protein
VVERLPREFRPGKGMRLGKQLLTPVCNDVDAMLQAQCGLVTIRIALDPTTQEIVQPIIDSLLAMFVPAHCRIELRIAAAGRTCARRAGSTPAGALPAMTERRRRAPPTSTIRAASSSAPRPPSASGTCRASARPPSP